MEHRRHHADGARFERGDRVLGCMMRVLTHTAAAVVGMLAGMVLGG